MNTVYMESRTAETASFGGVADAIGGIATAALAIIALAGLAPEILLSVATIVFGAALLLLGGALASEYSDVIFPSGAAAAAAGTGSFAGDGLAVLFLVGAAGIVLGILALLGIAPYVLNAAALIAFGSALMLSCGSVRRLFQLRSATRGTQSTGEFMAGEMASGSSGAQLLSGIAAVVLGILALSGVDTLVLTLVGLLIIGVTNILTGSTLSGMIMSFMRRKEAER